MVLPVFFADIMGGKNHTFRKGWPCAAALLLAARATSKCRPHADADFFAPSSCHGSHLAEHIQHFVMNETVAGYAFLAVDGSRLTFEVCDAAGRLPDHQISGRAIPRAEFQLPESVEATRGDVAQVQRRRTR